MREAAASPDNRADERPWLSVIMPIYNGARYLPAALESIATQGAVVDGIEIIAVDDGSTDGSVAILEGFRRRLPLSVVRAGRLGNWVAATNRGLADCRGLWCCFLHQDDTWLPGRLAAVSRAIAAHPHAVMVFHPSWFIDEQGRRMGRYRTPFGSRDRLVPARECWERLLVQNSLAINAPVFRTTRAVESGSLDESLPYTADWDLWLRLSKQGPAVQIGRPLGGFRIHGAAQTSRLSPTDLRDQLEQTFDRQLSTDPLWPGAGGGVIDAGRFSIAMNAALSGWFHGRRPAFGSLALQWLRLGPAGWRRYVRDSRIIDRVAARLRARLTPAPASGRDLPAAISMDASSGGTGRE